MSETINGLEKIIKTIRLRRGYRLTTDGKTLYLWDNNKRLRLHWGKPMDLGHFLCGMNFGLTNPHLKGE